MTLTLRRALATTAVPLLLLVSACGGEDGDGGDAGDAGSTSAPQQSSAPDVDDTGDDVLSREQLQGALLTAEDLPAGYEQAPVSSEDDRPTEGADSDCVTKFQGLDEFEDTAVATAEAQFRGAEPGTVLGQKLSSFESEDEVIARIQEVAAVLAECPSFTTTDEDGVTSTATISPLTFPELGDETLALGVALERPGFSAAVSVVVIRVGTTLQLLSQGGLVTDAAVLEQAARAGTEKVEAAG